MSKPKFNKHKLERLGSFESIKQSRVRNNDLQLFNSTFLITKIFTNLCSLTDYGTTKSTIIDCHSKRSLDSKVESKKYNNSKTKISKMNITYFSMCFLILSMLCIIATTTIDAITLASDVSTDLDGSISSSPGSIEDSSGSSQNKHQGGDSGDLNSEISSGGDSSVSGDGMGSDGSEDKFPSPEKPEISRINNSSIMVRWEISEDPAIRFFKIQYRKVVKKKNDKNFRGNEGNKNPIQSNTWKIIPEQKGIPAAQRAYPIEKLRPGTYVFRVTAVFDNNEQRESPACQFKLLNDITIQRENKQKVHPEPPVIESAKVYDMAVLLKWKYEDQLLEGFFVYYRSQHTASDFIILTTADERMEIKDLEPDTPYEFKVQAYNEVGVSEISAPISARTTQKKDESVVTPTVVRPQTPSVTIQENPSINIDSPSKGVFNNHENDQQPKSVDSISENFSKQMYEFFKRIWSGENKSYFIMLVLVAVVFSIVSTVGCIFCCLRRDEDPVKNLNQFEQQVSMNDIHNGYFNSFAEVEVQSKDQIHQQLHIQQLSHPTAKMEASEFQYGDYNV